MADSTTSARAAKDDAAIQRRSQAVAVQIEEQQGWLERKLKPKKITARYPFKGTALLYTTCAFGSLGDGLFGYNSGKPMRPCSSHCSR
jgi:hypothetical protein